MVTFVSTGWVEERLSNENILVIDPRTTMRYLRGHLKNAVSLPISKALDPQGRLLPVEGLERWIGAVGLDDHRSPVVYDGHDGRNGAMLAWTLEYLGRTDVHLMDSFWEGWRAEGRELFYRPVTPVAMEFTARVNPGVRATLQDVRVASGLKLLDVRSVEEYAGRVDTDEKPGHIPGAKNLVWQRLLGEDHRFLLPLEELRQLLASAGITRQDRVVTYCRMGTRAAVSYLALKQLEVDVRLYDGSYAEWMRNNLPVETEATS